MPRYSAERKAALLKKLLPPVNLSMAELARQEGISEVTLYAWRKQAKAEGAPVPGDKMWLFEIIAIFLKIMRISILILVLPDIRKTYACRVCETAR